MATGTSEGCLAVPALPLQGPEPDATRTVAATAFEGGKAIVCGGLNRKENKDKDDCFTLDFDQLFAPMWVAEPTLKLTVPRHVPTCTIN